MTEDQVLADRVLVRPTTENKTPGGVFVSESAKGRPIKGQVVLVGPGTKKIEMIVEKGDNVLFGEYSGVEVDYNGEIFMIANKKKK